MGRTSGTLSASAFLAACLILLVLATACTTAPAHSPSALAPASKEPPVEASWKETIMTDLQGRGNFSISGFSGKTVIVSVVSVSCPTCIIQLRRQLDGIGVLVNENPERIERVALDLDPEEGPGFVAAYGGPANFTGYSARSPPAMTLALLHRFGPFAIDPETIPVILVCPDGRDFLLPPGLKTPESLNETIAREC